MSVCYLSISELLHERCRRALRAKNILRPAANGDDVVWQQMSLENFARLMYSGNLYCRAYGEYADYDEVKLGKLVQPHMKNGKFPEISGQLEAAYNAFEKKLFISCWYNSKDLSDVVFKVYAKGGSGIAIGTRVDVLTKQLSTISRASVFDGENIDGKDNEISQILCANTQYVFQNDLMNTELFEPAQVYAPIFLKGYHFQMDNEFRVCVEMKEPVEYLTNSAEEVKKQGRRMKNAADSISREVPPVAGMTIGEKVEQVRELFEKADGAFKPDGDVKPPAHCFLPVNLDEMLLYIALKDDGYFHELGEAGIIKWLNTVFDITARRVRKQTANGFMIFEVEKGGVTGV